MVNLLSLNMIFIFLFLQLNITKSTPCAKRPRVLCSAQPWTHQTDCERNPAYAGLAHSNTVFSYTNCDRNVFAGTITGLTS